MYLYKYLSTYLYLHRYYLHKYKHIYIFISIYYKPRCIYKYRYIYMFIHVLDIYLSLYLFVEREKYGKMFTFGASGCRVYGTPLYNSCNFSVSLKVGRN